MAVRVAGYVQHFPAVHGVPGGEGLGIPHEPHESAQRLRLPPEGGDLVVGHPVRVQVLGHTLENAVPAPGPHTLRVVLCSLEH